MHVKSVTIDGFKSYAQKTIVDGFDREFNAITGLNGSGKSNILDSICFVLGITNLSQVRANQLQDLVFKSGQAGVTKATVSILFDNRDKKQSPFGYTHCDEITVTRQIIVGGANKYMINGTKQQANKVADMFRSVQLNVNNPHFLIMQGRITKVLNMKPPEILSMIEEAAGTKMYETKKQSALKTIEKKNARVREIDSLLDETIKPEVEKLRKDRKSYMEYQNCTRQLEILERYVKALEYVSLKEAAAKSSEKEDTLQKQLEAAETAIQQLKEKIQEANDDITEMQANRGNDAQVKDMDERTKECRDLENKANHAVESHKEKIKTIEKKLKQIRRSVDDDNKAKIAKQKELKTKQEQIGDSEAKGQQNEAELTTAKQQYDALVQGKTLDEHGNETTLQQQLLESKKKLTDLDTDEKKYKMDLKHAQAKQKAAQNDVAKHKESGVEAKQLEKLEQEITSLQNQLERLGFDEKTDERLRNERETVMDDIQNLRGQTDRLTARLNVDFSYTDPVPNFDKRRVKGVVAKLFKVKDTAYAAALEVTAGKKLYNVIVDRDDTAQLLMTKGKLKRRETFIPLNKIKANAVNPQKLKKAQSLVGADNVHLASSLIECEGELKEAMDFIFGNTLVCNTLDQAKQVAYNKDIRVNTVTLEGDQFNPMGVISGGAVKGKGGVLRTINEAQRFMTEQREKEQILADINRRRAALEKAADQYFQLKEQLTEKDRRANVIRTTIRASDGHKAQEDLTKAEEDIEQANEGLKRVAEEKPTVQSKVQELNNQIKNEKQFKEAALKDAKKRLDAIKKKVDATAKDYETSKTILDTLRQEIHDLDEQIGTQEKDIEEKEAELVEIKERLTVDQNALKIQNEKVKEAEDILAKYKQSIKEQDRNIQKKQSEIERMENDIREAELNIVRNNEDMTKCRNRVRDCQVAIKTLRDNHAWIKDDEQMFGAKGSQYDFSLKDKDTAVGERDVLRARVNQLKREVNTRAMQMLTIAEEKAEDLENKREKLMEDKNKLYQTIEELDEKKKEAIQVAWTQINKDFGNIFSTLLPGTQAKLVPPKGKGVMDGLEVKVAFGNTWKESLAELSGGQRSLVALSLVLAMLKFKPAPIYILDEVDAALDLSHTQNIGSMIKTYFKESQFIVVSLKDGMFNNANVLFKTRFVDGCSTVSRSVNIQKPRQSNKENRH